MSDDLQRSIPDRIAAAYEDESTRPYLTDRYLDRLLDSYDRLETRYQRTTRTTLAVTFLSLLLTEAAVERVALSGVELRDLAIPQRILPAVAAVLVSEVVMALTALRIVSRAIEKIMELSRNVLWRRDLEVLIGPMGRGDVTELLARRSTSAVKRRLLLSSWFAFATTALVGPVAFVAYSYWRVFSLYGVDDVLSWVSLAVAVAMTATSVLVVAEHQTLTG